MQSGGFLGRLCAPLLKNGLLLMKSVIQPLAKSVLISLGLTSAASAANAGIHKKILGSGTTALIISNDEMENISEKIKNEAKDQKGGFLSMLLGTLGTSLLGNMLAGKGIIRAGYGN